MEQCSMRPFISEANFRRVARFVLVVLLGIAATTMFSASANAQHFSPWADPVNLGPIVNSSTAHFFPSLSKDGLSLYFNGLGRSDSLGGWDIYVSQRASLNDSWGPPQNLGPDVNTPYDEGAPFVSIDGHRLYFQSNRPGGFGGGDLYVSRRHDQRDDFGWQTAENLGSGVNTDANEAGPSVYDDDAGTRIIFFSSDRPGGPGPIGPNATGVNGQQGSDIYMSFLQSDGSFGPAQLVAELSSASFDRRPFISRDGLSMILSSDRPGTIGGLDLWIAARNSTSDLWPTPVNLGPPINSDRADAGAVLSFDSTDLYFQSARPGKYSPSSYDLWVSSRTKLRGPK